MQMAFFFNQARCSGCEACVLACRQWYYQDDERWTDRRWLLSREEGKFPDVAVTYLTLSCLHCEVPACIPACPGRAITKRIEDGIVIVDEDACIGQDNCGGLCKDACPYEALRFLSEGNGKIQKCDFCLERLLENKKPICVAACPTRALDYGPLDELKAKYGEIKDIKGFVYSPELKPSIVFKAKTGIANNSPP